MIPGNIRTHLDKNIDLTDFRAEDLDIRDIAHALARLCRFNGHVRGFYSVARHCIAVARICPEHLKLDGLLHDAAEAYIGDMSGPLKVLPIMDGYRGLERLINTRINDKFGVFVEHPDVVRADKESLQSEMSVVFLRMAEGVYNPKRDEDDFLSAFKSYSPRRINGSRKTQG